MLFIPRLTMIFLKNFNDTSVKVEIIKKIMDVRETEVLNFRVFLEDMKLIESFLVKNGFNKLSRMFLKNNF